MQQDIELVTRLHVGRSLDIDAPPVLLDSKKRSAAFNQWFETLPEARQHRTPRLEPHQIGVQ